MVTVAEEALGLSARRMLFRAQSLTMAAQTARDLGGDELMATALMFLVALAASKRKVFVNPKRDGRSVAHKTARGCARKRRMTALAAAFERRVAFRDGTTHEGPLAAK
jgi:hypothetical protein